jgi:hypothetical protein
MLGFGQNKEEAMLDKQLSTNKQISREQGTLGLASDDTAFLQRQSMIQDLTKWQQNLEDDLETLRHDFKSERLVKGEWVPVEELAGYDKNGEAVYKTVPSLMNDIGIYRVTSIVKRYLTRNVMMSNLSEEIICRIMKGLVTDLVINIGMNWQYYEIDYTDLSLIVRMVKDTVEPTLYRCLNNGERTYLNTISKRVEAYNIGTEEKKKGLFS